MTTTHPRLDSGHALAGVTDLGALKSVHERKSPLPGLLGAGFYGLLGGSLFAAGAGYGIYALETYGQRRMASFLPIVLVGVIVGGVLLLMGAGRLFALIREGKLAAGVYAHGVALVTGGRARKWRWDEVNAIQEEVLRHYLSGMIYTGTTHRYTLIGADGTKHVFDDRFKDIEALGAALQENVGAALLPRHTQALNSGQRIDFGELAFDANKLYIANQSVPWSEFKVVKIDGGSISFHKHGAAHPWVAVSAARMTNVHLFHALVRNYVAVEIV